MPQYTRNRILTGNYNAVFFILRPIFELLILSYPLHLCFAGGFALPLPCAQQLIGAARALKEAGGDVAVKGLERLATNLISGGSATESIGTMDIKAAIIRVSCKNCIRVPCPTWRNPGRTCPQCIASEGYFQIAVAFRLR